MSNRLPCFTNRDSRLILEAACRKHGVDLQLLEECSSVLNEYTGSGRRAGITEDLSQTLEAFLTRRKQGA